MEIYMGVVEASGILEVLVIADFLPKVMAKVAFMFGSSKHGNARRASMACI
jgi:hypothetical protein